VLSEAVNVGAAALEELAGDDDAVVSTPRRAVNSGHIDGVPATPA
jgi:hypothetical protein